MKPTFVSACPGAQKPVAEGLTLPRRPRGPLFLPALTALLIAAAVHPAQLVPLGPPLAARALVLTSTQALFWEPNSQMPEVPLAVSAAAQLGDKVYGFVGATGYELASSPAPVVSLPEPVRAALTVGEDHALVLVAGRTIYLWQPGQPPRRLAVPERYGAERLTGGFHGGREVVLVMVRKTAPFDPVLRLRPFLYVFEPATRDLVPIWKGTSFARPFVDVVLADVAPGRDQEVCALEELATGERLVTAYQWTGVTMEAVATTKPLQAGTRLERATTASGEAIVVMERAGNGWRPLLLKQGNQADPSGVKMLITAATGAVVSAPLAWTVLSAPDQALPAVLALQADGGLRQIQLR